MLTCFICSPYGGKAENIGKAREYMRLVLLAGYVPVAPHVMLHGIMDDSDPEQRASGMEAGLRLLDRCATLAVCGSTISPGMEEELLQWRPRSLLLVTDEGDVRRAAWWQQDAEWEILAGSFLVKGGVLCGK